MFREIDYIGIIQISFYMQPLTHCHFPKIAFMIALHIDGISLLTRKGLHR